MSTGIGDGAVVGNNKPLHLGFESVYAHRPFSYLLFHTHADGPSCLGSGGWWLSSLVRGWCMSRG